MTLLVLLAIAATSTATIAPSESSTTSSAMTMGLEDLSDLEAAAEKKEKSAEARADRAVVVEEIEVSAQRVAEAAKPDTELRVTRRQLIERGVTNLAQALDIVLDTAVRISGRGGYQVDVRGSRKGGVLILLDGVPISDPFVGNFDVSSIPATDIAEIRVSLTPASPLDGPGGNGGVIEVLTRGASGPKSLRALVQASDSPGGVAAVSGRAAVAEGLSIRASGGATIGLHDYSLTGSEAGQSSREDARGGNAGLRIEKRFEASRMLADLAVARRRFLIPPVEPFDLLTASTFNLTFVDREDVFRGVVGAERRIERLLLTARAFSLVIDRDQSHYSEPARARLTQEEHVFAHRSGGTAQADWFASDDLRLTLAAHLSVEGGRSRTNFVSPTGEPFLPSENAGVAPIAEPAAGFAFRFTEWLALDGAAGVAFPIGLGAPPWPEAKLTATFTPTTAVQVRITGARKGRLPNLSERFDPLKGNKSLDPEQGTSADVAIIYKPRRWLSLELGAYARLVQGFIRLGSFPGVGMINANLGDVAVDGLEARADLAPFPWLFLGGAYTYGHSAWTTAPPPGALGRSPLDFFPAHRFDVSTGVRRGQDMGIWARARYLGARSDNGTDLAAVTTVDATAFVRVDELRVTLRAENLLDNAYEIRAGVLGFGRTLFLGLEGVLESVTW
jgi:outer membrane receptor protein involved in Fe transport